MQIKKTTTQTVVTVDTVSVSVPARAGDNRWSLVTQAALAYIEDIALINEPR